MKFKKHFHYPFHKSLILILFTRLSQVYISQGSFRLYRGRAGQAVLTTNFLLMILTHSGHVPGAADLLLAQLCGQASVGTTEHRLVGKTLHWLDMLLSVLSGVAWHGGSFLLRATVGCCLVAIGWPINLTLCGIWKLSVGGSCINSNQTFWGEVDCNRLLK